MLLKKEKQNDNAKSQSRQEREKEILCLSRFRGSRSAFACSLSYRRENTAEAKGLSSRLFGSNLTEPYPTR
jgi:hypothetical protein